MHSREANLIGKSVARRQFFYRTEIWKTTLQFRLLVVIVLAGAVAGTRGAWSPALAWSLVCRGAGDSVESDVLLIENLDDNYLLFERAAALQQHGYHGRVLVLVRASAAPDRRPDRIPAGFAQVMIDVAGLHDPELVPIDEVEPITLSAAYQVRSVLRRSSARAVMVLSDGFRSRRTYLAYAKALAPVGIQVQCMPVWGTKTPENWTRTWHGIQDVLTQIAKLQYYRVWVL